MVCMVSAMAATSSVRCAVGSIVVAPSASIRCKSCSATSCSSSSSSLSSSAPRLQRLVSLSPSTSSSPALTSPVVRPAAPTSLRCQSSAGDVPPAATAKIKSILCTNCEGNGAVVCSQCEGEGLNTQDFFGGRFKAGTICWLCRGKKQMLCGNCNGAGFMGGFLNTQDD